MAQGDITVALIEDEHDIRKCLCVLVNGTPTSARAPRRWAKAIINRLI